MNERSKTHNVDRSDKRTHNQTDTLPKFERSVGTGHASTDQSKNRGVLRKNSSAGKFFTLTEKAMRLVNANKTDNIANRRKSLSLKESVTMAKNARLTIENMCVDSYNSSPSYSFSPSKSAVSQLVDLEEEMAKDDFDYNVFRKKEEPVLWKPYTNTINQDLDKLEGFLRLKAEPVGIWNERQAREKHVRSPKCEESGLVAVWQVMLSLGVTPKLTMEDAQKMSFYRRRDETSPLPQFLFSCSRNGMTHTDLLRAMETLSSGRISGRFFEFYPQRRVDIRYWLAGWIKRGVVPLATLNYQKPVRGMLEEERALLPKDWYHHMVYAVSYEGIHVTNPISKMKNEHFKQRIESESVVLIPRDEILGRLQADLDFEQLKTTPEWKQMNVIGQIEVVEREEQRFHNLRIPCGMKFIAIPSCMVGGITLFAFKDTENYKAIMSSDEVFLKM